jgi:HAD superfamily hydrolase (TIGR01456 family)
VLASTLTKKKKKIAMAPQAVNDDEMGLNLTKTISKEATALQKVVSNGSYKSPKSFGNSIPIPDETPNHHSIEVPAVRPPYSDASQYMHSLSLSPSMKDRRGSRNSFGTVLPIPRSKRQSRLSSVAYADQRPARPGMPPIQPTREILAAQIQDVRGDKVKAAKDMAFVFDIDGVLVHGDRLIEEGKRVLEILNGDNELGIKVPHIFLTNGSGKLENDRCAQLSKILGSPISTNQFIQSHTPMQALTEYYSTVLVVGGDGEKCRQVAETYGFKDVIRPLDIVAWDPTIPPFFKYGPGYEDQVRKRDFSTINIEAILVLSDSRDYATDLQIIMDLLQSKNGRLGTRADDPLSERIPIYFSQGDILNPTEHWQPRMTQGTFRIGLEAMYKTMTGEELERVVYGKPERATYLYADEVMASWMEEIHNEEKLPKNIYMIGDNPNSDIVGGNMYGWNTCLVKTGVYNEKTGYGDNKPTFGIFENVLEVIKAVFKKELGEDFKFNWSDDFNPIHANESSAIH